MSQPTPNRNERELERLEAISALERGPATPDVSAVAPTAESEKLIENPALGFNSCSLCGHGGTSGSILARIREYVTFYANSDADLSDDMAIGRQEVSKSVMEILNEAEPVPAPRENESPAVSPVPPTAAIPFSISVALDHAIAYLTGEYDEDFPMVAGLIKLRELLSAPPVAPSEDVIQKAIEFVRGERDIGMSTADPWGPIVIDMFDRYRRDLLEILESSSPAPSVGELEWRITDDEIYESEYWRIEGDGTRWLLLAWDGNEGVVMQTTDTLAAAKSLANSLQRILSGAAEEGTK